MCVYFGGVVNGYNVVESAVEDYFWGDAYGGRFWGYATYRSMLSGVVVEDVRWCGVGVVYDNDVIYIIDGEEAESGRIAHGFPYGYGCG